MPALLAIVFLMSASVDARACEGAIGTRPTKPVSTKDGPQRRDTLI